MPLHNSLTRFFFLCLVPVLFLTPSAEAELAVDPGRLLDLGSAAASNDRFGNMVARGDFNGDGWDDLAVTATFRQINGTASAGQVFVYYGAEGGLATAPGLELSAEDGLAGSDCRRVGLNGRFGGALAVADFDGDGFDDLAIGAYNNPALDSGGQEIGDVGAVSVFWGAANSTLTAGRCFVPGRGGLPGAFERFGRFGFALAVGDFQSDGVPDLAIGAPFATADGEVGGTVTVVYGEPGSPLDPVVSQLWHQDVDGIDGFVQFNDQFGAALATGDLVLGQDTACDLVIGVPDDDLNDDGGFQGSVHVLFGCTATGLSADDSVQWTGEACLLNGSQPDAGFGTALAVGDFDGRGAHDLAIGAPRYPLIQPGYGSVCVLYGNQQNPDQVTGQALNKYEVGPNRIGDVYGSSLATFAVDGELDRLLVGAPGGSETDNIPAFLLYRPEPDAGIDSRAASIYELSPDFAVHDLGSALTSGRFCAQGPTVAAGVPGRNHNGVSNAGSVWLLTRSTLFTDGFETGDLSRWDSVVE